jgi:hypothetical protein
VSRPEELWIPLVDQPIGSVVAEILHEDPELERLVSTPHRLLAFKTFAYIRVGLLLGELLVDFDEAEGDEDWVEGLLASPDHRAAVAGEVRAVAEEIAGDPADRDEDDLGPDDETRRRFRDFAREQLGT